MTYCGARYQILLMESMMMLKTDDNRRMTLAHHGRWHISHDRYHRILKNQGKLSNM